MSVDYFYAFNNRQRGDSMRVLVGCEESGTVRDAFAALGHDAWSCDILPRRHPKHLFGDVRNFLGREWEWDIGIFHPPCTYLAFSGMPHWDKPGRAERRVKAMEFFMECYNAEIDRVCVENPLGQPNVEFRKPDQIINPFNFGHPERKRTCLWLRGLPPLEHTNEVEPEKPLRIQPNGRGIYFHHKGKRCSRRRSKFWPGIAAAMASQWGSLSFPSSTPEIGRETDQT